MVQEKIRELASREIQTKAHTRSVIAIIVGLVLTIGSWIIQQIPIISIPDSGITMSVGYAHGLCQSTLGRWGQMLSSSVYSKCQSIGLISDLTIAGIVLGIIVLIIGIVVLTVIRRDISRWNNSAST